MAVDAVRVSTDSPVTTSPNEARQPPKLLAAGKTKIRIALASGLALTLGAWLAPRAAQTTLTPSEERAAPLLEEQVQLREASRVFVGVQDVAADARAHSVSIPAPAAPSIASRTDFSEPESSRQSAGFGVFVSDTHVLTHSVALDGRSAVPLELGPDESVVEARVVAYEPATGLVLLQTATPGRTPATLAAEAPAAGALAVGVGRSSDGDVAVPVFVTRAGGDRYTIGSDEAILPGMPVFNLAGELFAVATPDGREVRAIPVRAATERLLARAASGERPSSFGIGFQSPSGSLTGAFGETGVVITQVLGGGPADIAGLQLGDVILAVGETTVDSAETAARAFGTAMVGMPVRLQVRRAGRMREVAVTPALAYDIAALARTTTEAAGGPEARTIFPAAILDANAMAPSARVLSVNGRAVTSRAQAQRELRLARAPVPVLLQQGNRRYFVAIEPAR
jgi:S1-C subfamily serine protease